MRVKVFATLNRKRYCWLQGDVKDVAPLTVADMFTRAAWLRIIPSTVVLSAYSDDGLIAFCLVEPVDAVLSNTGPAQWPSEHGVAAGYLLDRGAIARVNGHEQYAFIEDGELESRPAPNISRAVLQVDHNRSGLRAWCYRLDTGEEFGEVRYQDLVPV